MRNLLTLCSLVLFVVGLVPAGAGARTADPQDPVLVGRIAHIEGNLLRYIEEDRDWVRTVRDAPFGLEDSLYVEDDSRAEFIMPNNTWIRAGEDTQLQLIALYPDATTLDVGLGLARVYNKNPDGIVKVTTPFGAVVALGDTVVDVYVGDESVEVIAIRGTVDFLHEATGRKYEVREGFASIVADSASTEPGNGTVDARWDDWNVLRDNYWARRLDTTSRSAYYLPEPIREEAATLEEYGRWERVSYQGAYHDLWRPTRVEADWRPYTAGRWIVYYGDHCWVPDEPFGYVTHHYGSWVYVDSARSWYWAPPVVRAVSRTPSLFLSFSWYPGRVGWLYDDRTIGWVPLAPDEPYYGYRHWGRSTTVIVRDRDYRIDLSRYRYLDSAIVVPRDRFYGAPRYSPYVERTVNRTVIVNNYRPTTIINNTVIQNFNSDRGRFSAYAGRVERKPHASTLQRIHDNQRIVRERERFNRQGIERDLKRMTSAALPAAPTTEVRRPRLSSRMVETGKVDRPFREMSLPQREIKPRERERQIRRDERAPVDVRQEPASRVRSPREDGRERDPRTFEADRQAAPDRERRGPRPPEMFDREGADRGRGAEGQIRSPREERQERDPRTFEADRQAAPDREREAQGRIRSPREDRGSDQRLDRRPEDLQERRQQEERTRQMQADDQRRQQDIQRQRQDDDRRQQQEVQRQRRDDDQRRQQEVQRQRRDDERRQQQEVQRQRQADERRQQQEVQRQRQDDERRQQQEVQRQRQDDERRQQQEVQRQRQADDQRRQQEVQRQRQADEQRRAQEVQRKRQADDQRRQQEVQRQRQADEQRRAQEVQRKRQADDQRRQQEVQRQRQADDQRRQQEVQRQRQADDQRRQQEVQRKRQADDQRRQQEVQRKRQADDQRRQQEVQRQRQADDQRKQQAAKKGKPQEEQEEQGRGQGRGRP